MPRKNQLTDDQVREIVKLYKEGWGHVTIARIVGTTETQSRDVLRGKSFRRITGGRIMFGKRPSSQLQMVNQYAR